MIYAMFSFLFFFDGFLTYAFLLLSLWRLPYMEMDFSTIKSLLCGIRDLYLIDCTMLKYSVLFFPVPYFPIWSNPSWISFMFHHSTNLFFLVFLTSFLSACRSSPSLSFSSPQVFPVHVFLLTFFSPFFLFWQVARSKHNLRLSSRARFIVFVDVEGFPIGGQ